MAPAIGSIAVLAMMSIGGLVLLLITVGLTAYAAGWGWNRGLERGRRHQPTAQRTPQQRQAREPAPRAGHTARPPTAPKRAESGGRSKPLLER